MAVHGVLDDFTLGPFSRETIKNVHSFFEDNAGLYSFDLATFTRATIDDEDFDSDASLIAVDPGTGDIVAAMLAIIRKASVNFKKHEFTYTFTTLNMFCVHVAWRRKGIGSAMLAALLARLKAKGRKKVRLMASAPNYLWPGLDPRYTAAYFFLRTNGFNREKGERQNLLYHMPGKMAEPPVKVGDVSISRAGPGDRDDTVAYVRREHPGVWPQEVGLSFKRGEPVTTFVARNGQGTVVGFASHSIQFPGSFGPTGVLKSLRGKGVGSALLKWCAHDLKQRGMDRMIIMWVEGTTMKFYSKSIGARIHHVYWKMQRKL